MSAVRRALSPDEREALARRVADRLFRLPEVTSATSVLVFYSFGSEVPTAEMAERLLSSGKRLLLPYLDATGMEAAEVRSGDRLVETDYGPKEPGRRVPVQPEDVDAVITPGLAFDRRGHRLGYGGGHYDRYLARLGPGTAAVAIAFDVQVLAEVPADEHDRPVDILVTDAETVDCRRERAGGASSPSL